MAQKSTHPLRIVLYEGEGSQPFTAEARHQAITALLDKGFAVSRVNAGGPVAPVDASPVLVLGRFSAPPPAQAEDATGQIAVRMQSIESLDAGEVMQKVEAINQELSTTRPGDWKPWFPVIDYTRCTNCMQCLSFCLFGVYGVDADSRIQVEHNANCKTNCPACSRVCPEAAIMFPKYKAGPINGDQVSDADLQREKMKVDISALLGGDVYSLLRQRSEQAKSRFSLERDSDKALKERQRCLAKLVAMADIPPEVLMNLPSPEEIQRRALEAKARVQAVQDRAQPT